MSYDITLAKMLKDRDNKPYIGPIKGQVKSLNPLRVAIYDGRVLLDGKSLYITDYLAGRSTKVEWTGKIDDQVTTSLLKGDLVMKELIKLGDELLLIPSESGQEFFIIDKVRRLNVS